MPTFRTFSPDIFLAPTKVATRGRPDSEPDKTVAMVECITGPEVVFEVTLEADERPAAVRLRLLRAAKIAGVEIAVRKSARGGWLVGLMTDQRRSTRGRRPKVVSQA